MNYSTHHHCRANLHVFALKKSYALHEGTLNTVLDPPEWVKEPIVENFRLIEESDFFPKKSFLDIAIRANIFTPDQRPLTSLDAGIIVQNTMLGLRVTGQRSLQIHGNQVSFSEPEPFTEIPLVWEEAYGGHDDLCDAEGDLSDLAALGEQTGNDLSHMNLSRYRRNPFGKGFILHLKSGHDGKLLPRVELAHDLITPQNLETGAPINWHFKPSPACFDWIHYHWFPRSSFMVEKLFGKVNDILPHRPLPEYHFGYSREDLFQRMAAQDLIRHPRMFNAAHPALQVPNQKKNLEVVLWHMTQGKPEFRFILPYQAPKISLEVPGETKTYRDLAFLSQVIIDMEKMELTGTWHCLIRNRYPITEENQKKIRFQVDW